MVDEIIQAGMLNGYNKRILDDVINLKPVLWINPMKENFSGIRHELNIGYEDILDADARLNRFSPLIKRLFPETGDGVIESKLVEIPDMKSGIERVYGTGINGRMFLKCDNSLMIAGSVKARGGIYEVLKHAEDLALTNGILSLTDDYSRLGDDDIKKYFAGYKIAVGSTGNLGISIGVMASALGFHAVVHMSADARQWKKDLLRSSGVEVVEHKEDYTSAVKAGRLECAGDMNAYFVDDENSRDLFLGYSAAALRLKLQMEQMGISIGGNNKLYVYLPCGVGGAPCGIAFGLKHVFGDDVHCYFAEPVHSPCMLLGLITRRYSNIHVNDFGIDNMTEADGLAVGSPSKLASNIAEKIIDGIYTVEDDDLFRLLAMLKDSENIKVEPSAAAGLKGPCKVTAPDSSVHIAWATGGLLVPDNIFSEYYLKGVNIMTKCK